MFSDGQMLKVHRVLDADVFWSETKDFFLQNEVLNSTPIGLIGLIQKDSSSYKDPHFYRVSGTKLETAAVMTPPYNLMVTSQSGRGIKELAEFLNDQRVRIPGVVGLNLNAEAFAKYWGKLMQVKAEPRMKLRMFELEEVRDFGIASGEMRQAIPSDLDTVKAWYTDFCKEANLPAAHVQGAQKMGERKLNEGNVYLWIDGNQTVCLAGFAGSSPNTTRIGPVYTPKEFRKKGYGKSLVAQMSQKILAGGKKYACLSTDLSNPTSNKIYQEIGYRPVGDYQEIEFLNQN